jgi:hypothetical protein
MSQYHKYPRTMHLPWSLGLGQDDKLVESLDRFVGREVVVTDKLDGECTSLYRDHYHARSLDSKHHPSRTWVKATWGNIRHDIPEGWRICGENVYALHSIHYHALPAYFLVFAVYDEKNACLSWDDAVAYAGILGLTTVPVLYRGVWDEERVKACWTGRGFWTDGREGDYCGVCGRSSQWDEQEGYVVRLADAFPYDEHHLSVAKFVRKGHVQTDSHWLEREPVANLLYTPKTGK